MNPRRLTREGPDLASGRYAGAASGCTWPPSRSTSDDVPISLTSVGLQPTRVLRRWWHVGGVVIHDYPAPVPLPRGTAEARRMRDRLAITPMRNRRRPAPVPSPACLRFGEPSARQLLRRHAREIRLEVRDRRAIQHVEAADAQAQPLSPEPWHHGEAESDRLSSQICCSITRSCSRNAHWRSRSASAWVQYRRSRRVTHHRTPRTGPIATTTMSRPSTTGGRSLTLQSSPQASRCDHDLEPPDPHLPSGPAHGLRAWRRG
jgi:hypothetical protein